MPPIGSSPIPPEAPANTSAEGASSGQAPVFQGASSGLLPGPTEDDAQAGTTADGQMSPTPSEAPPYTYQPNSEVQAMMGGYDADDRSNWKTRAPYGEAT